MDIALLDIERLALPSKQALHQQPFPLPVFRVLADLGGLDLSATEGTWNLGIGFLAVVSAE